MRFNPCNSPSMSRAGIRLHLNRRLGELEAALTPPLAEQDPEEIEMLVGEVLGALYALEERFKRDLGAETFYSARESDPDGSAAGGLIWIRGLVVHKDPHLHKIVSMPADYVETPFGRVPLSQIQVIDASGSVVRAQPVGIAKWDFSTWKARSDLPEPDLGFLSHDRDVMYDQRVAGRDTLDPLREAVAFFNRLDTLHPDVSIPNYASPLIRVAPDRWEFRLSREHPNASG